MIPTLIIIVDSHLEWMEPIIWSVQRDTDGWDGPWTVKLVLLCPHHSKDLGSIEEMYQANTDYVN